MQQTATPTQANRKNKKWFKAVSWYLLVLVVITFLFLVAFKYLLFSEEIYGRFWSSKYWVLAHVIGGSTALIIGPFQFWDSLRKRKMNLHRSMGKIYLLAIVLGGLSAFVLCATTAYAINWQWGLSLGVLGVMWWITAGMAYLSIRKKKVSQHKEWMIRSYVVTFAFVMFRLLLVSGMAAGLGDFAEVAPSAGWLSWTIPLAITEVILQSGKS